MKVKPDHFMPDRNNASQAHGKFHDFKCYVKDFYYIFCNYENFPNNIVFCDIDVEKLYLTNFKKKKKG